MQVAHPVIAAGVSQHSEFGTSGSEAVARLRRTLRAMLALTFGDEAEAARAAATINAIHDRVHGEVVDGTPRYPAGTRYSAHDPELLLWVHATFVGPPPRLAWGYPPAWRRRAGTRCGAT
jgi:uncharacterized protein (DUF2236 family)